MGKSNALLDGQPLNAKTAWHGWSVLPFPSPGDLPNPGIEPWSPALQADTVSSEPPGKPLEENEGTAILQASSPSGELSN